MYSPQLLLPSFYNYNRKMKCFDEIQIKKSRGKEIPPTCQIWLKDRSYSILDSQVDFHVSFRQGPSPHSIHRF